MIFIRLGSHGLTFHLLKSTIEKDRVIAPYNPGVLSPSLLRLM